MTTVGAVIAEVGSRGPSGSADRDLAGALVTPAFVDLRVGDAGPTQHRGYGEQILLEPAPVAHLSAQLIAAGRSSLTFVDVPLPELFVHLAAAAEVLGPTTVRSAGHRWHAGAWDPAPATDVIGQLATWGLTVIADPTGPVPLARLLAAGVPLAFTGPDRGPWELIQAAVLAPNPAHRLSVRAAVTAVTRAPWRLIGREGGILQPGASATLTGWRTGELVIPTPDRRIAAWSTVPGSARVQLPKLAADEELPTCLFTMVNGQIVFDAQDEPVAASDPIP